MIKIREQLCPSGRFIIKCPYTRTPTRLVIHNTANDATAENEISYMISRPEQISFHYAVDDNEAVQGLPLNRNAWASGDGHGKGNMEGIHIEICYSLHGGERFDKAEDNAAQLAAYLLKQYGWGMDRVTKHQDYDGKYCPHRTLDKGWDRFKKMIEKHLKEDEIDMTKEEVQALIKNEVNSALSAKRWQKLNDVPAGYYRREAERLMELGVLAGKSDGKIDLTEDMLRGLLMAERAYKEG